MNTRIAKKLVSDLPLNINDIARLVLEITETLGERAAGLSRLELLSLLRRVMAEGVQAVEKAEQIVSFEEAARRRTIYPFTSCCVSSCVSGGYRWCV